MSLPKPLKKKMFEQVFRHQTNDRFEDFRKYTSEIEAKFSADKSRLASSFSEAIEGLSKEECQEVELYFSDDYYTIEEINVGLYRTSTLVSIYSFLENLLNNLCRHLQKQYCYPVELVDLRGEGIVRAKSYLAKLAGIDFSLLNKDWSIISDFNKIRNCIVHSEGNAKVSSNSSKLINIVNNADGLSLKNEKYIKVSREYIDFIITKIENFIENLCDLVFK